MIFETGQHILFIGDSITDCGRRDIARPYGDGYMSLVRAFTIAAHPQLGLTWTNRGVSGDTVRDLQARWKSDVTSLRPDWLSVMIGINDVLLTVEGHQEDAVPLDEFETTLRQLLPEAVDTTGCKLILADPFIIEPNRDDPRRSLNDEYAAVVARLATEVGAVHVATQAAVDRALTRTVPSFWADDRIHPNLPGHAVIARAFLDAIG
jgi:lysophospholipase L1-like esterase